MAGRDDARTYEDEAKIRPAGAGGELKFARGRKVREQETLNFSAQKRCLSEPGLATPLNKRSIMSKYYRYILFLTIVLFCGCADARNTGSAWYGDSQSGYGYTTPYYTNFYGAPSYGYPYYPGGYGYRR